MCQASLSAAYLGASVRLSFNLSCRNQTWMTKSIKKRSKNPQGKQVWETRQERQKRNLKPRKHEGRHEAKQLSSQRGQRQTENPKSDQNNKNKQEPLACYSLACYLEKITYLLRVTCTILTIFWHTFRRSMGYLFWCSVWHIF